jgi:D-alanine--poly(phosphoribitol) ligase subunit 1
MFHQLFRSYSYLIKSKNMLYSLISSFNKNNLRNAFCIDGKFYTYKNFSDKVSQIQTLLARAGSKNKNVGIVTYNDIETYASIYAVWLSGFTFVPLNFKNPVDRNSTIISQADIGVVLSSKDPIKTAECIDLNSIEYILSTQPVPGSGAISIVELLPDDTLYILFTSGSTGLPKGVPISLRNVNAFIDAFFALNFKMNENDRFLQMFDLTFDVSVACTLIPLLLGACVYTVPPDSVKYTYVLNLLRKHNITFATLVPSLLSYLLPFFDRITLPDLKYCVLTAEASQQMLVEKWAKCVPNAEIINLYGPTEATIWCTGYKWTPENSKGNTYNGLISIGTPFKGLTAIIVNEKKEILPRSGKGELCIAGDQITKGYWGNAEKNQQAFFTHIYEGKAKVFYKTGDLCYYNSSGEIMYCGRLDNQVQIQGFRVELSEIEHVAKEFIHNHNVTAIAFQNTLGNMQIHLFVENYNENIKAVSDYLQTKLPYYMMPSKISVIEKFPINHSNKIDRKKLQELLTASV